MIIKIPPWDVLAAHFGIDHDGDIVHDDYFYFSHKDEALLDATRLIEISDETDEDDDYQISSHHRLFKEYLNTVFVDFCLSYNSTGTLKTLGFPHV